MPIISRGAAKDFSCLHNAFTALLGADLIAHGLAPGPTFSTLLEQTRDSQLDGEIRSREEALALIDRLRASPNTLP